MRILRRSVRTTRPLGCRGQLPNTQGSLVAQAGSSHGTYLLRGPCPLGLLKVILTGDRPGIVTDFVTNTGPAWICDTALKCQSSSATDH